MSYLPLDRDRVVLAAYLAGRRHSLEEVAEAVDSEPGRVRHSLILHNIGFDPKPFGMRELNIWLTKAQFETLGRAARVRSIQGLTRHANVLEMAIRLVANDPTLLDAVLDDGYTTPKVEDQRA